MARRFSRYRQTIDEFRALQSAFLMQASSAYHQIQIFGHWNSKLKSKFAIGMYHDGELQHLNVGLTSEYAL